MLPWVTVAENLRVATCAISAYLLPGICFALNQKSFAVYECMIALSVLQSSQNDEARSLPFYSVYCGSGHLKGFKGWNVVISLAYTV